MYFLKCGRDCSTDTAKNSMKQSSAISPEAAYVVQNDKVVIMGETSQSVYNVTELEPDPAHYNLLILIGKGCFDKAQISLGKHVPSDTFVAIKRLQLEETDIDFSLLQNEQLMHRKLRHPNLLPALCSFVCEKELWTVLPLMAFGSCRDLLHAHFNTGLPEEALLYILYGVLQGLDYLHQRGLIHRTVRASHVLVSASGQVALTGFRQVLPLVSKGKRLRAVHDFPNFYQNSLLWASPELLAQNRAGYDTKSDIYSFGVLICELANGMVPFEDRPSTQMLLEKLEGTQPRLLDSRTIPEMMMDGSEATQTQQVPFQRTFSVHLHNIAELCLALDPNQRPTAAALIQHGFFRSLQSRKSGSSLNELKALLPELLRPVTPLTSLDLPALAAAESEAGGVEDALARQMEAVGVTDDWEFE